MHPRDMTTGWLRSLDFDLRPSQVTIEGVVLRDLDVHLDGRGEVTELWSEPWGTAGFLRPVHVYQSATDSGVIKCWHLHDEHTDQFAVTRGKLQISLVDLREESVTFQHVNTLFVGTQRPALVKIPPGVLHGWKALTSPEVLVVNLQTHVYDPDDEYRFAWDTVLMDLWEPRHG